MLDRLGEMERRYLDLERQMGEPEVLADIPALQKLHREYAALGPTVTLFRELQEIERSVLDAQSHASNGDDEELREMARAELEELEAARERLLQRLQEVLVRTDPNDGKNAIMEIRAGAGGDEAALFASEMFRMYSLYAEQQGWQIEIMNTNETGIGGFKEMVFRVEGKSAYKKLKYESGVHRVQRIPVTESGGRIHTSTVTVIVLPEAEEVDVEIRAEDLRVDVYRSSGHGGQGVNTTDSAVRLTHLPTGLVVTCQNERSQLKNKASAMSVLRSRLYGLEEERRAKELGQQRRSQVQTGDRSEKIRTYNFPQDRVTDHRIGVTLHNLPGVLNGAIASLVDQLEAADKAERLQSDHE